MDPIEKRKTGNIEFITNIYREPMHIWWYHYQYIQRANAHLVVPHNHAHTYHILLKKKQKAKERSRKNMHFWNMYCNKCACVIVPFYTLMKKSCDVIILLLFTSAFSLLRSRVDIYTYEDIYEEGIPRRQ